MIFFYRVRGHGVVLPAAQVVYLTQAQRQNYSYLYLEAGDYEEPGWHAVSSPHERIGLGWGELLGLKEAATDELLAELVPQWVRREKRLGSRNLLAHEAQLNWERLRELSSQHFYEVTGLSFSDFHRKTTKLTRALWEKQQRGGRREKCCVEDYFYLVLCYREGKCTYQELANRYGLCVSRIHKLVKWVEKSLSDS